MDDRARSSERRAPLDPDARLEWLRARVRAGELPRACWELRARCGDLPVDAGASRWPPAELAAWVEGLGEVDERLRRAAALGAGALCVGRLLGWPAGAATGRALSALYARVGAEVLTGRSDQEGDERLAEAEAEVDDLRQLIESIRVEHRLVSLSDPRALSCGVAAVIAARAARAGQGVGAAIVECAQALGGEEALQAALRAQARAAAARWERPTPSSPQQEQG